MDEVAEHDFGAVGGPDRVKALFDLLRRPCAGETDAAGQGVELAPVGADDDRGSASWHWIRRRSSQRCRLSNVSITHLPEVSWSRVQVPASKPGCRRIPRDDHLLPRRRLGPTTSERRTPPACPLGRWEILSILQKTTRFRRVLGMHRDDPTPGRSPGCHTRDFD